MATNEASALMVAESATSVPPPESGISSGSSGSSNGRGDGTPEEERQQLQQQQQLPDAVCDQSRALEVLDKVLSEYDDVRDASLTSSLISPLELMGANSTGTGTGSSSSSGSSSSGAATSDHPIAHDDTLATAKPASAGGATASVAATTNARSVAALQSGTRQSEDDGYVSMNGRRRGGADGGAGDSGGDVGGASTGSPPATPGTSPPATGTSVESLSPAQQVTLPKTRTTDMISRFASLPSTNSSSTGPAAGAAGGNQDDVNSGIPRALVLGIGISAVHSAVLSGATRIPETIVNEHPVTIYPGRCSPTKRNSVATLPANGGCGSPRQPSLGSAGPASPRIAHCDPSDGSYMDASAANAAATMASFVVHQRLGGAEAEQKLSKLFATALRSDEAEAAEAAAAEAAAASAVTGELITLKSVFSNAARLSGATGAAARTAADGDAEEEDGCSRPAESEEFSDDSLEEPLETTEHSSQSPSITSSVASLPSAAAVSVPSNRQRQVAQVHAALNAEEDDDVDGPWVLRKDVALQQQRQQQQQFGQKTNHIEPLDYNYSSVNSTQQHGHHRHMRNQHQHLHSRHDEIRSYNDAEGDDDDEWPQPPPANCAALSDEENEDDDDEEEDVDDEEHIDNSSAKVRQGRQILATDDSEPDTDSYDCAGQVKINDTYVIRKGCKQRLSVQSRHQFSPIKSAVVVVGAASVVAQDLGTVVASAGAGAAAGEQLCTTNSKFVSSIRVPFTRHSIDLGGGSGATGGLAMNGPSAGGVGAGGLASCVGHVDPRHAARTRLSLDLGSPNKALPPPPNQPATASTSQSHLQQQQQPRPTAPSPTPTHIPASYSQPQQQQQQQQQQQHHNNNNNAKAVLSPRYSEFKKYKSTFDAFYALDVTNSNHQQQHQQQQQHQPQYQQHQQYSHNNNRPGNCSTEELDHHQADGAVLMRVSSLPSISPAISGEKISTTPRRELAPPLEEDEEQDSERDVPLRQIENNISALLRGDIAVARVLEGNNNAGRRPSVGLRSGVHKSESAKEMLLSQNMFGPLPPSPPGSLSSQEVRSPTDAYPTPHHHQAPMPTNPHAMMHSQESYGFPPLPPLPPSPPDHGPSSTASAAAYTEIGPPSAAGAVGYNTSSARRTSGGANPHQHQYHQHPHQHHQPHSAANQRRESAAASSGGGNDRPPSIPPHRGPSCNTLKTRSMDAGISRSHRAASASSHQLQSASPQCPPKSNSYDKHRSPQPMPPQQPTSGTQTRRRLMPNGFPKRVVQSPRDEHRLQTSLSLPETPIFARGCDVPRTPHRRQPVEHYAHGGSRTAPRQQTACLNSSVMGIGNTLDSRHKLLNHQAFAGGEMLRLAGGPARGWYPRQRQQQQQHQHHEQQQRRPLSTENLEGLSSHSRSARFWDGETPGGGRKPLTLPPNLSPKFFNKSPRDALRRVTSLLIRKGASESKKDKDVSIKRNFQHAPAEEVSASAQQPKKKSFFKSFWKKSKHISLDK